MQHHAARPRAAGQSAGPSAGKSAGKSAGPSPGGAPRCELQRYTVGGSPSSLQAIVNTRRLCEAHPSSRHVLDVIDSRQHPEAAALGEVLTSPTLVKAQPLPRRRFIGDMSHTARLLAGLDLPPEEP